MFCCHGIKITKKVRNGTRFWDFDGFWHLIVIAITIVNRFIHSQWTRKENSFISWWHCWQHNSHQATVDKNVWMNFRFMSVCRLFREHQRIPKFFVRTFQEKISQISLRLFVRPVIGISSFPVPNCAKSYGFLFSKLYFLHLCLHELSLYTQPWKYNLPQT